VHGRLCFVSTLARAILFFKFVNAPFTCSLPWNYNATRRAAVHASILLFSAIYDSLHWCVFVTSATLPFEGMRSINQPTDRPLQYYQLKGRHGGTVSARLTQDRQ
jgi:hypothetical protein